MGSLLEELSPRLQKLKETLERFVVEECQPAEEEYELHIRDLIGASRWTMEAIPPCIERLKRRAQTLGLWNLFHELSSSVREYGILCEIMGQSFLAPEACNCSAPDTGNMEVLMKHGTPAQQQLYLQPLLQGKIRSAFLMTEPQVASSDATNIQTKLTKLTNDTYILNGRKWWSTGAMDPRCKVALVLAKMDYSQLPQQQQQHASSLSTINPHKLHTGTYFHQHYQYLFIYYHTTSFSQLFLISIIYYINMIDYFKNIFLMLFV